jgi:hypothetical protein
MNPMNKLKLFGLSFFASLAYTFFASHAALADVTKLNPYSWDPGLYATTARYDDGAHAWGQRKTGGAWGTGPVNYQSGATANYRAGSSGSMSVVLEGTYCPGGACQYGSGSGYKGLVQFWNDPNNYIAFGLIHDPGVSPTGNTLMIEGAGGGRPVGGYWAANGISGVSHRFTVSWTAASITLTIDNNVTLGPYPVAENNPSVSFLAAGRDTGDICDTTFAGITFSTGSVTADPVTIPSGSPYFTYTATMNEGGSGTGYSSYINAHDSSNNALSVGIQTDSSSPESNGQPYYIWELVQNGIFTYNYLNAAASNTNEPVTLSWWQGDQTAVFYEGATAVADISANLVPRLFFQVEGNARLNGDSVNDSFTNTQVNPAGSNCPTYCGLNGTFNTSSFNFYGLTAAQQSCSSQSNGFSNEGCNFTVTGTVSGLPAGGTWDTNEVAGIGMIAQYWNGQ